MHYRGKVFRAISLAWAHKPLSGDGAMAAGGRFNAKGVTCYYTSLHYHIALRESLQGIGDVDPTVVIQCDAEIDDIEDLSTPALMRRFCARPIGATRWTILASRKAKSSPMN